jgi:hypothetical protein
MMGAAGAVDVGKMDVGKDVRGAASVRWNGSTKLDGRRREGGCGRLGLLSRHMRSWAR